MSPNTNAEPPTKKIRHDGDNHDDDGATNHIISSVISPTVFPSCECLRSSYRDAKPYPHGIVRNLCVDGFLSSVLDEVKMNSKVQFKESDLFRVYQSVDLANLSEGSEMAEAMPHLVKLRAALYSDDFRSFVERASDLPKGTLTGKVDCAANCHAKGCHLLCHDDVIGTRKVSYIIYLTDPDPEWKREDGGHLELYGCMQENSDDQMNSRVPCPFPDKTILPHYNSMAYFVVAPGKSFHSVQEVFCDRPRLSIQGWYHAKHAPEEIENATLNRLKSTAAGEDTEGEFVKFVEKIADGKPSNSASTASTAKDGRINADTPLASRDKEILAKYLNPMYLAEKSMKEIRECFEDQSSVQLRHFLNKEWEIRMKNATTKADKELGLGKNRPSLDYRAGVSDKWAAVGPAHKQRFLEYVGVEDSSEFAFAGASMLHLKKSLFQSPAFGRWLQLISSLGMPKGYRGKARRFRPGLDYTVAHYGILTQNAVLDATLCLAAGSGNQLQYDEVGEIAGGDADDAIWDSGDAGGFECYIAADEDSDGPVGAADEYNDDDDTKLLSVSASNNTLSLVYRDPGTMRFVKYVGSGAPSSRWDLSLEYEVEDTGDSEDEDNSAEEVGF